MAQLALQVMKAIERKKFMREMLAARERDIQRQTAALSGEEQEGNTKNDRFMAFSKSYFSCGRKIPVVTSQTREILARRMEHWQKDPNTPFELTSKEEHILMSVAACLRLIHQGQDFVQRCIVKSLYYEQHKPFTYIREFSEDSLLGDVTNDDLPCYYILRGSVEVTYNRPIQTGEDEEHSAEMEPAAKQIFEPNVIYTHSMGEYMGLVSPFGPEHDFVSPSTIYVKEQCDVLCIDRRRFHAMLRTETRRLRSERQDFLDLLQRTIGRLTDKELDYLKEHLIEQKLEPNRVVVQQGVMSDWLYLVREGRVRLYKQLPYTSKTEFSTYAPPPLVSTCHLDAGCAFAIECVLHHRPTDYHYVTVHATTLLKLHKSNFEVFSRQSNLHQNLDHYLYNLTRPLPSDRTLNDMYVTERKWMQYRRAASASVIYDRNKSAASQSSKEPKFYKKPEVLIDRRRVDNRLVQMTLKRQCITPDLKRTVESDGEKEQVYKEHRVAEERVWMNRFRLGYINSRLQGIASTKKAAQKPGTTRVQQISDSDDSARE